MYYLSSCYVIDIISNYDVFRDFVASNGPCGSTKPLENPRAPQNRPDSVTQTCHGATWCMGFWGHHSEAGDDPLFIYIHGG